MEFTNRNGQPATAPTPTPAHAPQAKVRKSRGKAMRIISAFLLVSVALLVAAIAAYVATSNNNNESSYVNKDKFQAVFLNGGQVYFGKIRELNSKYFIVDNIYYLRVNNSGEQATTENAQQDISLAKLGCELHGPEDQMVINREQVTFWENLKDDAQVTKAIAEFVKQNPQGQKCTTPAAS